MITQVIKNTTLSILLFFSTATLQAFELINPFSECNQQQSEIMKTKCEPLSGEAYTACERETLKQFFKCVESDKRVKDGK